MKHGTKIIISIIMLLQNVLVIAQKSTLKVNANAAPNLIIITTDGLRWQELYTGIDTAIANNPKYNEEDSAGIYNKYKNQPIMPFVTNYIGSNGQLWGNRNYECVGSVSNKYWFSYPGYSELFCGYVDDKINSNDYKNNPNTTLLDYLQKQPVYHNKIAAFGAWHAFERILNKPRAGFPITNAFDKYINGKSTMAKAINKLNKEAYKPFDDAECLDVFTHNMALDYLKTQQPKVLYISYGETDEWAHEGKYKSYLNAARQVDDYIKEIWNYVQSNAFYHNNTVLLITTDHGRGIGVEWTSHNAKISRSNETWFAILGTSVQAAGVVKSNNYLQEQLAQTIANLLELNFAAKHPVAKAIELKLGEINK